MAEQKHLRKRLGGWRRRRDHYAPPTPEPLSPDGSRPSASCHTASGGTKKGYGRRSEAKRAMRKVMAQGAAPLHAYHCPSCGYWHLGNP